MRLLSIFYGCTKYGLMEWFREFETISAEVSDNFTPVHALAWIASECDAALRRDISTDAANTFSQTSVSDLVRLRREPRFRNYDNWHVFESLTQDSKEISAAGFQFLGRKPLKGRSQGWNG